MEMERQQQIHQQEMEVNQQRMAAMQMKE